MELEGRRAKHHTLLWHAHLLPEWGRRLRHPRILERRPSEDFVGTISHLQNMAKHVYTANTGVSSDFVKSSLAQIFSAIHCYATPGLHLGAEIWHVCLRKNFHFTDFFGGAGPASPCFTFTFTSLVGLYFVSLALFTINTMGMLVFSGVLLCMDLFSTSWEGHGASLSSCSPVVSCSFGGDG
jgi:hypothetical protein